MNSATKSCMPRNLDDSCHGDEDCDAVIDNSFCSNGSCSCITGFYGNVSGDECVKRKVFDPCNTDIDCSVVNNSLCLNDTCQCEVGRKPARLGSECVQNEVGDKCDADNCCSLINNSHCEHGECTCYVGFHSYISNQTCVRRKIFDTCSDSDDCSYAVNSSICEAGQCQCPVHMIETEKNTACRPRVLGDVCTNTTECSSAVDNSDCTEGVCKCLLGYQATVDVTSCTLRRIGDETCAVDIDCEAAVAHSKCRDGVCSCISGYMMMFNGTECVRRNISSVCTDDPDCSDAMLHSVCDNGTCACLSGYKAVNNVSCELRVLDDTCDIDADCFNAISNSNCSTGLCKCNSGFKPFERSGDFFATTTVGTNELAASTSSMSLLKTVMNSPSPVLSTALTSNSTNGHYTTAPSTQRSTVSYFTNSTESGNESYITVSGLDSSSPFTYGNVTDISYEFYNFSVPLVYAEDVSKNNDSSSEVLEVVNTTSVEMNGTRNESLITETSSVASITENGDNGRSSNIRKRRGPRENIVTCVPRLLGDYCQVDTDCSDSVKHSTCRNGSCVCSQGFNKGQSNSSCQPNKIWDNCTEDADCHLAVKDSWCLNGKCRCQGGFQVNAEKTLCNKRRIYDNTCHVSTDCSLAVPFSICFQRQCICNTGYFATNGNQTCTKFKIGDKCHSILDCKEAVSKSSCRNNICHCVNGYMSVKDNTECQERIIGDPCTVEEDCSSAVFRSSCSNGTCSCKDGYDHVPNRTMCVSSPTGLLDGCTFNAQCERLANHSVCGGLWGSKILSCICTPGLFVRKDRIPTGECYAPEKIGDYCMNRAWCDLGDNVQCDDNDKRCSCRTGHIPNATYNGCIRLPVAVGEFCRYDSHCAKISNSFCYDNSTCQCYYKYQPSADKKSCIQRPFSYMPSIPDVVRGARCDVRTRRPCHLDEYGQKYERCAMDEGQTEHRCLCVPGYISKFDAPKFECKEIQTYYFSIVVTHELGCINETEDDPVCYLYQPIRALEEYNNDTSELFLYIRDRIVVLGLSELFMDTQARVRDRYMNSEVINITEVSEGMQVGVLIYLLADYYNIINETELEAEMIGSLIRRHGEIGRSQLKLSWPFADAIVYRDFDECTEQGGRFSDCSGIAWCLNTRVSYMCSCRHGYEDWSPDSDNRPGRVCELPQDITTDSLSCSNGKCENQWEYISLALVGFGFMLFFFIGYEIYARKKKLEKSDIYYKLQKARIREVRERRKTIKRKKNTDGKKKKEKQSRDEEKQLVETVEEVQTDTVSVS